MRVLFCRPAAPQGQPDGFDDEAHALEQLGVEPLWITTESVVDDTLERALAALPENGGETLLRSWMLTEAEYARLEDALSERGYYLVNDAAAYAAAHYLPNYFDAIAALAAPTCWTYGTDLDEAWEAAQELGPPPYFLKDHVKSAKEDPAACYVPAGAGRVEFGNVCRRLIEHRGERFERGLVVRAALPLAPLGPDADGTPTFDEYRLFFLDGALVAASAYYDAGGSTVDFGRFEPIAARIDSRFIAIDVARLVSGAWAVIEVGDGGVSTLPPQLDPRALYRAVLAATEGETDVDWNSEGADRETHTH